MPLEIGKTYLDIWGRKVSIQGATAQPHTVWSLSGNHYDKRTGKGHGCHNIVLKSKAAERKYWEKRIQEIEGANSEDKLRLVKNELDNMKARLHELSGPAEDLFE